MPKFFIDRPVFAWVIALLILLIGGLSVVKLPVAQYPSIAPPSVSVSATYAGASAETLQNSVTTVIEQQMNGIDGLLYMSSNSQSSGQATITLYFQPGTNPDIAQVQVQNKLQLAMPRLPTEVQQQGVKVAKATRNYLMFVTLSSTDGSVDAVGLGNYISSSLLDQLSRVTGVGEANLFGSEYAMRVWVSPDKLNSFKMTTSDIIAAIKAQNVQVSAGELGGLPAIKGQQLNATIRAQSRLSTPEQFGNILLRVNKDGSRVLLRDVARIELGAQTFTTKAYVDGKPAAAVGIKLAPSANALATAQAVRDKVKALSPYFPAGVKADVPYDTSKFVKISIEEVVKTLIEAVALVFLVMYLFLQNFRATLIPTIVVPVALAGTLGAMAAFGFSINVLTMFGMVLAIGMLVDDAIVVVENVERIMSEEGLPPRKATRKAMEQITNALIGISLVLTAVFIPMAFFGGSVGAIYRQFSLSLVASMVFSVLLALTLTPALCATLLKPVDAGHHHAKSGFFGWFNRSFAASTNKYQGAVAKIIHKTGRYMLLYFVIIGVVALLFARLPSSFLPEEDQGYSITMVQLPTGATAENTRGILEKVEQYYLKQPETAHSIAVAGFGFNGNGQNLGLVFTPLKDWDERKASEHHVQGVIGRAFGFFSQIKDSIIYPLNPPPIPELGNATGFDFMLQDRSGQGHDKLMEARNMVLGMAAKDPRLTGVRPQGMEDAPQFQVTIDQEKASSLGLSLADINSTLSTNFGSSYVNDFTNGTRVQQVIVQADAPYRMQPQDIEKLFVRNASGTMVPFSAFASAKWSYGSPRLERYNGVPSMEIVGTAAPGKSSGEAMQAIEEIVAKLPAGFGIEWTGQSYEERLSGSQAPALFAISLVVVFLCLAALYESWSIPFSVMLVVPLGVFGALLAAHLRGLPNDVFFKVGLLTTIGLSTKNAILIIEFAKDLQAQGKSVIEATLEAVHLRLRPILMTSMAFVLGVLPLAISNGAGSASQHAIGTGVIGGMLSATFLAIFFVPVFFVVVRSRFKGSERQRKFYTHHMEDEDAAVATVPVTVETRNADQEGKHHD
ncbi:efflux RND transporter permease subunit [Pseudogulbenkiania ferrooxidans]|uniref:Efflux pump membrane transporter n=1 Tax=Pseudogulbenkiania ferrooxidans 2002 TaxID=279714 RepID=B9YZR1_9NEIS|nr:efflux RND transporter permease subunit [Pseudogulbenkiania ferrooxidans]EEG09794.1 transporter, hydrophobe/amphiphile efflux-1 (HAE1) family [Pseudogulbenkiania ferrooxidans 2002]